MCVCDIPVGDGRLSLDRFRDVLALEATMFADPYVVGWSSFMYDVFWWVSSFYFLNVVEAEVELYLSSSCAAVLYQMLASYC